MDDEKLFHVGVKALIVNEAGQVLLMEEDGSMHVPPQENYWDLPGGRVKQGEVVLETLKREVEEETGITKFSEPEFYTAVVSNHSIPLKSGITVGLVLMVYKVKIDNNSEITLSHEHAGFEWTDLKLTKERLQHKYPNEFTDVL